jgi:hypothetical protein
MISNITIGESDTGSGGRNSPPALRGRLSGPCETGGGAKSPQRKAGAGQELAQWLAAWLLVLAAIGPCPLRAQSNAANPAVASDRYLLIVETSSSMQHRADAVRGAVWYLLGSGLDGEFRDGGTLGVWTFSKDLSAGRLPLQTWSYSAQKDITQCTVNFLARQKYGKRASFDKLVPALLRLVEESERLTVILISSGECKIRGMPFDDQINAAYHQFHDQQQKARMPFVSVLRARHGQVVDYVVNTPPWPLHLARLAEEHKAVEPPRKQPGEASRKAPSPQVAPMIISGKKPQPEPAPVPKPEPLPARTEPSPPVVAAAVTNAPATMKPPQPDTHTAEAAEAHPAPVASEKLATETPPKPAPAMTPISEPKLETVKAPEAKAAEPAPAHPEVVALPPAPKPTAEPVPAKTEPSSSVVAGTATNAPATVKPSEPAAPPAQVAKAQPAPVVPEKPATEPTPNAAPARVSAKEPKAETVKIPEAVAIQPPPAKPEVVAPAPAPKPAAEPAPVRPEQPAPAIAASVTKEPTVVKPTEPAALTAEGSKPQPAPVAPEKPATQSPPKLTPAPTPMSEPKLDVVRAREPKAAEPAPVKPQAPAPAAVPMSRPEPVAVEQPKPAAAPEVKTEPAPVPAVAPVVSPSASPNAITAQAASANVSSLTPPPTSRPVPLAQSATATPTESFLSSLNIGIAGALLALVAAGVAFLLMRRPRVVPQGSLITRSFEREKGP